MMFDLCRTLPPSQPGLSKQHEAEEIFADGSSLQQVQKVSLKWSVQQEKSFNENGDRQKCRNQQKQIIQSLLMTVQA